MNGSYWVDPSSGQHPGPTGVHSDRLGRLRAHLAQDGQSGPTDRLWDRRDEPTPYLLLDQTAMDHNIRALQRWCTESGVGFLPHGKTTMAPSLWLRQLAAGADGITVATEGQVRVALEAGVPWVHLAGTVLRPQGVRWLAEWLATHPEQRFQLWLDSPATVSIIGDHLREVTGPQLDVVVEWGIPQGRTGCRTRDEAVATAGAVNAADRLRLVGIAGYEGAATAGMPPDLSARQAAVDCYLAELVQTHRAIAPWYETEVPIITAGGSAWFDRVVATIAPMVAEEPTRLYLRPGAYITHDHGLYERVGPAARGVGPRFQPAATVVSTVVSTPESGLAILDAGRRDLPTDQGMPIVLTKHSQQQCPKPLRAELTAINDQHGFLRLADDEQVLQPGDLVTLGISHPCTAFDKYRSTVLVDGPDSDRPTMVERVRTWFP